MCNPHTEVGQLMVQEFYGNLWITYKDIEGVNEKTYESYVRGKTIIFTPTSVREALHLLYPPQLVPSYNRRMDNNQELNLVIEKLYIPGSQWRLGAEGKLNHLKSTDLTPLARGWLDFVRRSIMPTSNRSKCTVDRDVMIYSIIQGEVVEVEDIIPEQIYKIASSPYKKASIRFPHLIYRLCEAAGVKMENDVPISVEKPITKKRMMTHREQRRVHLEEQVEKKAQQDQPPPQGQHDPPQEYWQQLDERIFDGIEFHK
ncbi:uncharacterized protein DS421_5g160980 [Arachis hypogaea]|nr:uncharacterized protein DS421_5g160980 [Arachis hypogaea]